MKDAEEGLSFGCTAQIVTTEDEILNLIECGNSIRKVAQTNMNVQSSRSHAILQLVSLFLHLPWKFKEGLSPKLQIIFNHKFKWENEFRPLRPMVE